ncbi:hypothetical protein OIDMADRAFT_21482 [Oidiodendron maius Zn]|uniref:Uncharacterized protein n=1 Tax=Oidiodendron maius (strain Zn) TaxID=913774 RepID=A0A0C3GQP8_OIDMZ|nr:hypothetical protein OIDMADRAFT_21482 [Oidiodendron maius Zn]
MVPKLRKNNTVRKREKRYILCEATIYEWIDICYDMLWGSKGGSLDRFPDLSICRHLAKQTSQTLCWLELG